MSCKSSRASGENRQIPIFVHIMCCPDEAKTDRELEIAQIIQSLPSKRGRVKLLSEKYPITYLVDHYLCRTQKMDEGDIRIYVTTILRDSKAIGNNPILHDLNTLPPCIHRLFNSLPKTTSVSTIRIGYFNSLQSAVLEMEDYSRRHNMDMIGAGLIKNHLMSTTFPEKYVKGEHSTPETWILFAQNKHMRNAVAQLNMLIDEICRYTLYATRLNKLFQERSAIFRQIESSEKITQERIQDILVNVRRPHEQVTSADLSSMLNEVSGTYSRLTTITSSMRRDSIIARRCLHGIREIFSLWDEKPVLNYPANTAIELTRCESRVNAFNDNIDRLEALRSQLNIALDTVKTYVGIKQQSISLEEQRSMKSLLARMFNLQEVLHKLEILVVAFYITEMGRLLFETVAREMSNVLTVAFIPIALIFAIGIRKLLHKHENKHNEMA